VCGLVAVCAFALQSRAGSGPRRRLAAASSVAALVALLIGTFGGVSSLIAIYLTPQIRTWSRITIFIAFFAAVLLVLAIDWFIAWMKRRTGDARPAVALVVVLGLAGFLDQAPPAVAPDHAKDARTWQQGAQFISQVEDAVPPGSMILQLPYVPYPEAWLGKPLGPYDHFTGYLHSDSLRWSFGAIRGSAADWLAPLATQPPSVAIDAAAAAGFAGVYVDLAGYEDDGRAVRQAVDAAVGRPVAPIVSPDGRREFFSLAGARENLTARLGPQRMAELARLVAPPPG